MKSSLFEVQNLVQRPTFALAHDFYDAAKLLSDASPAAGECAHMQTSISHALTC